jgi:hypothetical protein
VYIFTYVISPVECEPHRESCGAARMYICI